MLRKAGSPCSTIGEATSGEATISDAVWAEVAKHVTEPGQQVEFVIAMGNWMMFSMLFRNLRIPLAEGVMVWSPDGLVSPAAGGCPGKSERTILAKVSD